LKSSLTGLFTGKAPDFQELSFKSKVDQVKKINPIQTQTHTTTNCGEFGSQCRIPNEMLKFLLDRSILYCSTLTLERMPHITPIMYTYEIDRCLLSFLIEKKSVKARNLRKNPFVSFTADISHQTDPLQNTGIMVNAIAELFDSEDEIADSYERIRRRYSSHLVPELVEKYAFNSDLLIRAAIFKIVHWRGPFFTRFVCKSRMKNLPLKKR
jgi:nitroimidazol reductase NimA-like FMN-containing flavoprotein (pyridoxamine 5'-phosphate oxidase superfamily)